MPIVRLHRVAKGIAWNCHARIVGHDGRKNVLCVGGDTRR